MQRQRFRMGVEGYHVRLQVSRMFHRVRDTSRPGTENMA